MRIRVAYDTTYTYERPARALIQALRLAPREHAGQRVPRWRVRVEADGRLRRGEDAFGNILDTFYLGAPLAKLVVSVAGEVVTTDTAGVLSGLNEPFPPAAFLRETELTEADGAIRDLAEGVRSKAASDTVSLLHDLMGEVKARMRFDVGQTDAKTTAAQALALGHGVCQDLSHVMIAAARRLGVPARYVSGHLLRSETPDQEAGHAWMEAWADGVGWIGFDPTNAVCPTEAYVRIATALDYLGAAPVRGSRSGGGGEVLDVRLRVEDGGRQAQQ